MKVKIRLERVEGVWFIARSNYVPYWFRVRYILLDFAMRQVAPVVIPSRRYMSLCL